MKNRISTLTLSGIREFSARYQAYPHKVFLTIGEPDLDTPQNIKDAAFHALNANMTHYPPAIGLDVLRDAVALHETTVSPYNVTRDNVIITNGATEAIALALWSLVDEDDEVLVFTPSFPLYQTQTQLSGATLKTLDLAETEFQLTADKLAASVNDATRVIIYASPNNPTGTLYNQTSINLLIETMRTYPNLHVIVDEVYRSMVYGSKYVSIHEAADLCDRIIVVQSFSKSHAMTGWRVGYAVATPALIQQMHRLHQNINTGISSFSQIACVEALKTDTSYMCDIYALRRQYVTKRLDAMRVSYANADGAFFIFINIKEFEMTSEVFATYLAETFDIVMIPGIYFGTEGFVRLSYGASLETLEEGLDRFERGINALRNK